MSKRPQVRRRRRGRRAVLALATVLLALLTSDAALAATQREATEYDLKAAFLFHFTLFVEWPESAFAGAEAPLQLCILGPDPFGQVLDDLLRGERAAGRPLRVQRPRRPQETRDCHLLFLAAEQDPAVLAEVPGVAAGTVLTVGETPEFLAHGGLLRFTLREGRLRLQASATALERTRLELSSKLLSLVETVRPERP